jgi:hypothetical protein
VEFAAKSALSPWRGLKRSSDCGDLQRSDTQLHLIAQQRRLNPGN